jgi:TonB-linked SusC/RagA family outer membrane protein
MAGKLGKQTLRIDPITNNYYGSDFENGAIANTNWYKELFKSSTPSQEHSLNVSGGNEVLNYFVSGDYLQQDGFLKLGGDKQDRYGLTAKINAKLSEKITVGYIGRFTRQSWERPSSYRGQTDFWFAEQAWPILPLYDNNGNLRSSPSAGIYLEKGGRENNQTDRTYHQFNFVWEVFKGFKINSDMNFSITDQFHHKDNQKMYNYDVFNVPSPIEGGNSSVQEDAFRGNFFNPNLYAEYSKTIGDHNFKVMAGAQAETYKYRSLSTGRNGIIDPSVIAIDATSGVDNNGNVVSPSSGGRYDKWTTAGYFGRLNYNYKEKYLLEANLRYDGSSRFRSDKRWNLFPSVSAGWNIAKENFWQGISGTVNTLKLRASYGALGNQNTQSYYPTYTSMGLGTAQGYWLLNGVKPNTASAPSLISTSLTWEKIKTYNGGIDVGFLKNRLTASFDYYVRYTSDMVGPAPTLPVTLGTDVPSTNNTDLKTYGFELELAWKDQLSSGFGYNVRLTLADSKTQILKYPNPTGAIGYKNNWNGDITYTAYHDGEIMGQIWGYETIGIAKSQPEMDAHLAKLPNGGQSAIGQGNNWSTGDIMYADLNKDGKIDEGARTLQNHGDLKVIGNITPRYLIGFTLGANWKGFDFQTFFQGVLKRDYFQNSYMFWGAGRSKWETTFLEEHMDYFRADANSPLGQNLDAYYPRPIDYDDWSGRDMGKNHMVQTKYMQNAAYLRLKNLQIGYSLPDALVKKVGVQRLRIYVSGENILTITNLTKIFDPETIDNRAGGNAYPLSKVYSIGLNLNF